MMKQLRPQEEVPPSSMVRGQLACFIIHDIVETLFVWHLRSRLSLFGVGISNGQGSIKRKMGLLNRTRIVVPLVHLNIPLEAANAALFVQNGQNTHESFGQMLQKKIEDFLQLNPQMSRALASHTISGTPGE